MNFDGFPPGLVYVAGPRPPAMFISLPAFMLYMLTGFARYRPTWPWIFGQFVASVSYLPLPFLTDTPKRMFVVTFDTMKIMDMYFLSSAFPCSLTLMGRVLLPGSDVKPQTTTLHNMRLANVSAEVNNIIFRENTSTERGLL